MHKLLGHDLTWDSDYRYKLLLRGVKCHLGTAVKRKAPITPRLLLRTAHLFDFDNPLYVGAFSSSFLLLFAQVEFSFSRAAQVSSTVILMSDLRFDESFAYLIFCASKTIEFKESLLLPLPRIMGSFVLPRSRFG